VTRQFTFIHKLRVFGTMYSPHRSGLRARISYRARIGLRKRIGLNTRIFLGKRAEPRTC
jgi:hypothetical protein